MQFLNRLARLLEELDRISQKYQDEELRAVVSDLYKQLALVVNILEKVYTIYMELDILMKTDLRLDPGAYLEVELPQQPARLVDYLNKLRSEGHDAAKILAYQLGTGLVQLEIKDGEVYIRPKTR